jgi:hypothetical protein
MRRSRHNRGMSGMKSTAKKNGRCRSHITAESAIEPARRMRLI